MLQFRCPENRGVNPETCVIQIAGNLLHTVPVADEWQVCTVRISSVYRLTLRLKRKEYVTPRCQDPRQFAECLGEPIRRCVDDRVPAHGTSERSRFDRKGIELTLFELDVRMCGPSDSEHRLGHVHADDVEAMFGQKGRHSAWSAPNIGNSTIGSSLDQLDEGHEQRLVDGTFCCRADL